METRAADEENQRLTERTGHSFLEYFVGTSPVSSHLLLLMRLLVSSKRFVQESF